VSISGGFKGFLFCSYATVPSAHYREHFLSNSPY
jgi:hypothetical protein